MLQRPGRRPAIGVVAAVAAAACVASLAPTVTQASSHREAPLVAGEPQLDNTDVYAFVSPDAPSTVTMIANWVPFEEPNGGPNFYPFATDVRYNFYVDNDGDAKPDVTIRYTFQTQDQRKGASFLYNNGPVESLDDPNLLFRQTYTMETSFDGEKSWNTKFKGVPVAPSRVGQASMPNYQALRDQAVITYPGGWKGFAGQADDPFFLDLDVFNLLYNGDLTGTGSDTLAGYNVNSIALQVPFTDVAMNADPKRNPVIGIWSTTERPKTRAANGTSTSNEWVQVSRLGNALVNEVVVPASLKDAFNSISPDKDAGIQAVVDRVTNPEVPRLIEQIYKLPAPATPRNDLVEIFLTGITTKANGPIKADLNSQLNNADVDPAKFQPSEMLRLNLSVPVAAKPERLGVLAGDLQGYPNGRRLADDTIDISLQAVEGAAQTGKIVDALAAGDKVDVNDNAFSNTFPYLALPNIGPVNAGKGANAGTSDTIPPVMRPEPTQTPTSAGANSPLVPIAVTGAGAVVAAALFVGFAFWWRRHKASHLVAPDSDD